jgi:hypothetical protein
MSNCGNTNNGLYLGYVTMYNGTALIRKMLGLCIGVHLYQNAFQQQHRHQSVSLELFSEQIILCLLVSFCRLKFRLMQNLLLICFQCYLKPLSTMCESYSFHERSQGGQFTLLDFKV